MDGNPAVAGNQTPDRIFSSLNPGNPGTIMQLTATATSTTRRLILELDASLIQNHTPLEPNPADDADRRASSHHRHDFPRRTLPGVRRGFAFTRPCVGWRSLRGVEERPRKTASRGMADFPAKNTRLGDKDLSSVAP